MYDTADPRSLEKYSSAATLSDMEMFIFPELMYALVLANILSPTIWKWREHPWFEKMPSMNSYRKIHRTKQFIMDHYSFNLDLETWGLTSKECELARFESFIDRDVLAQSNALFGYHGDKYYFDLDIRKHFGLDRYDSDIIPYWKTETVEAMDAFRYKPDYPTGAGECVSLAALYASALFIMADVPLEKIYLLATPLHSQNFIDVQQGMLTNNRRLVTKNMWFNGSELSEKARRALVNERVTMVSSNRGTIHAVYDEATLPAEDYRHFSDALRRFLTTAIDFQTLANFLRSKPALQKHFQLLHYSNGKARYIQAEKVYHYEHDSKYRIGDATRQKLLLEIDEDEFYPEPIADRTLLDDLEHFFSSHPLSIDEPENMERLKATLQHQSIDADALVQDLSAFCKTEPRLPDSRKKFIQQAPLRIAPGDSREQIIAHLEAIRSSHPVADLAFSAYRDMARAPWKPFLKAALQRNPVCIAACRNLDIDAAAEKLAAMDNTSIYDGTRIAQPDEVWNFIRGDGLEKALCLMNIVRSRMPDSTQLLLGDGTRIVLRVDDARDYTFVTSKHCPLPEPGDFDF